MGGMPTSPSAQPHSIPLLLLKKYLHSLTKHAAKNSGERKTRAAPGEIHTAWPTAIHLAFTEQYSRIAVIFAFPSDRDATTVQMFYYLHLCFEYACGSERTAVGILHNSKALRGAFASLCYTVVSFHCL